MHHAASPIFTLENAKPGKLTGTLKNFSVEELLVEFEDKF